MLTDQFSSLEKPVKILYNKPMKKFIGRVNKKVEEKRKDVKGKVDKPDKNRLATECNKLDPLFEQSVADEGLETDFKSWPE